MVEVGRPLALHNPRKERGGLAHELQIPLGVAESA
jgi:hypothetical protein